MPSHRIVLGALALAGVTAACADAFSAGDVSGTYVLRTVGDTPVPLSWVHAPTITLATPSIAVRRTQYQVCAMGPVREALAVGTFHVRGTTLELALRRGDYIWRARGAFVGETITLQYPHPGGGQEVVEIYQRR